MSKAVKTVTSVGATALLLSASAAVAAPPTAFDQWSVTGGAITSTAGTAGCPSGFTCSSAVTGDGFFQRQITDTSTSDSYFQTVITDSGVTGAPGALTFSDESFVKTGNTTGIADKSQIESTSTTGTIVETFDTSSELNTGWAAPAGGDEVKIFQGILADDTSAADANDFRTNFWLSQLGTEGAGGKLMRLSSAVDIDKANSASQDFVLVERSVAYTVADSVTMTDASTLSWANDEDIKAIWVGQNMSGVSGVSQDFGYTAYENITTPGSVSEFSIDSGASTAPTSWVTADPTDGTVGDGWGDYSAVNLTPYSGF